MSAESAACSASAYSGSFSAAVIARAIARRSPARMRCSHSLLGTVKPMLDNRQRLTEAELAPQHRAHFAVRRSRINGSDHGGHHVAGSLRGPCDEL